MEEIVLANAAIALAEKLWPRIQAAIQRGEITPEQQADLKARIDSLRARSDGQFSGPEWAASQNFPSPVKPAHAD